MATSKEYLAYLTEAFTAEDGVSARAMMGEYILYVHGRVFADVCDGRLFVKDIPAAQGLLPDAPLEPPYAGAKPMRVVEDTDNRALLRALAEAMYPELSDPKPRKKRPKPE